MKKIFVTAVTVGMTIILTESCTTVSNTRKETAPATPNQLVCQPPRDLAPSKEGCPTGDWRNHLVIQQIDVGQGDSAFIRTPSGTTVLIDAGLRGSADHIADVLHRCYNLASLDYVVISHFHDDHMGGMAKILAAFPVRKAIYDHGDEAMTTKVSRNKGVLALLNKEAELGIRKTPALGSGDFQNTGDVKFDVVATGGHAENENGEFADPGAPNSVSIALKITYGNFDFYTGGDLTGGGKNTTDMESHIAKAVGDVDVMKANHHGSDTSNSQAFLDTLKPKQVLISCGNGAKNVGYKHPSASIVKRMLDATYIQNVFQTEKGESTAPEEWFAKTHITNGDIILEADKNWYSINGQGFATDTCK